MMTTNASTTATTSRIPEVKLRAYWRVILSHKWIALLGFLSIMGATALYLWKTEPVYEAKTMLMRGQVAQAKESLFGEGGFSATVSSLPALSAILKSGMVVNDVSSQMGINGFPITPSEVQKQISLDAITPDSSMLYVTANGKGPVEAAALANMAVTVYINKMHEIRNQRLVDAENFLQAQMQRVDRKLREAEEALSTFREQEGIIGSRNEKGSSTGLLNQLSDLYAELSQAQNDREIIQAKLDTVRQLLAKKQSEATAPETSQITSQISRLQTMLAGWEVELALLKQQYSYTTPTIRDLTRKIEAAQARLNALFQTLKEHGMSIDPVSEWQGLSQEAVLLEVQLRGLEQNEELLKSKIERFKADHPELISKEVEFARLERTARIHEQTYMLLIDKLEGLRLLRQMQDREMQVIERATPPEAPVKPNRRLVLTLGLLLGVMAGVGAAFFLEAMDDSLKAEVDVVKVLGVPVVGVIPVMKIEKRVLKAIAGKSVNEHHDGVFASSGKKKRRRFKKERKRLSQLRGRMITYVDSRSFFTESYRLLRTNLRLDDEQDSRVILVSGAKQGDGKTLTVVNLAIAMARVGVRTLMVDADLRNPKLHHLFGQTRSPGLCEALVSKNGAMPQAEIETNDFQSDDSVGAALTPSNCIRETDVENLYLLPSGATPDSPAELLGSRRMRQLIKALKSEFEVILFDSPPILPVTDATVLASEMADGVLLVVKSGETKREIAQRGRELLDKVNANLLGVVLNAIDYEKYYGSDYSYYYESHSPNDEAA